MLQDIAANWKTGLMSGRVFIERGFCLGGFCQCRAEVLATTHVCVCCTYMAMRHVPLFCDFLVCMPCECKHTVHPAW